jgi:hypothetical protein
VVIFRPEVNGECADCWIGWTVNDQTNQPGAGFDAASLRAFGVDPPDW